MVRGCGARARLLHDGVFRCGTDVTDGDHCRRHKERGACRIRNLREGEAGLAQFAVKDAFLALQPDSAGAIDMAQLMQHRTLLGKKQQQRKAESHSNPTHSDEGSSYSR